MADYLTLDDVDVAGRRVLVRADLNVPLDHAAVADDFRLLAFLPTVERLRAAGAVTVLCSHLGRPKNREAEFSMDPVAARLSALGDFAVRKLDAVVGPEVEAAIAAGRPGDVILLENTRFERGETKNDPALSAALARLGDLFGYANAAPWDSERHQSCPDHSEFEPSGRLPAWPIHRLQRDHEYRWSPPPLSVESDGRGIYRANGAI